MLKDNFIFYIQFISINNLKLNKTISLFFNIFKLLTNLYKFRIISFELIYFY